jgi:lathosterol oxidase
MLISCRGFNTANACLAVELTLQQVEMADWITGASGAELAIAVVGFFAVLTVVMTATGFLLERSLRRRKIWALPLDPGQTRHEILGNLVFVPVTSACFGLLLASGFVRWAEPSWVAASWTVAGLVVGFQVYYYGLHRLLHTRAFVRFHRWHHKSRVTTPLSGQSMSWVEALGWSVGYAALPALVSRLVPISPEGWTLYMALNVTGNIVGHANVEPFPPNRWLRIQVWLSNTFVFHALHHARWTGHYSFQAAGMDRLFGTEWPDWIALHARIVHGDALTSLRDAGNDRAEEVFRERDL